VYGNGRGRVIGEDRLEVAGQPLVLQLGFAAGVLLLFFFFFVVVFLNNVVADRFCSFNKANILVWIGNVMLDDTTLPGKGCQFYLREKTKC
jgi:hypothetical protein